jgi:hypothetical protein
MCARDVVKRGDLTIYGLFHGSHSVRFDRFRWLMRILMSTGGLVKEDIPLYNLVEALPAQQDVVTIPYVNVVVYGKCQRHQRYLWLIF